MSKATAISPANIAFIKFWGKADPKLNIPFNDSISMNLGSCLTTTTCEFDKKFKKDVISIDGRAVEGLGRDRVVLVLGKVRQMAKIKSYAKVVSKNNFPSDAGIASSASGFSALALAASYAANLKLDQKELSALARLGSGSACRSIPDGFTYWKRGVSDKSSYAFQIAPPDFWEIRDLVVVVSSTKKKAGSTEGHSVALTSPYFKTRLKNIAGKTAKIKKAILNKDFETFGQILEEEAIDLHVMAMTSHPPIFYWNGGTMDVIRAILCLREHGTPCYFTMDAGPNVHVICRARDEAGIEKTLNKLPSVISIISNKAGVGARII